MSVVFNPFTGFLELLPPSSGGGGGTITGVTSSNTIDFIVVGGSNVSGSVNLSAAAADSGYSLVNLSTQTDGIRAEIDNNLIRAAALNLQGPVFLLDNNTGVALSYSATLYNFTFIDYSIVRNANYETGRLLIANSSSSASIADEGSVSNGVTGVVFGVSISGGNVQVQYVTSSTGFNATFKYTIKQWS
jgi:hypothetical protein